MDNGGNYLGVPLFRLLMVMTKGNKDFFLHILIFLMINIKAHLKIKDLLYNR